MKKDNRTKCKNAKNNEHNYFLVCTKTKTLLACSKCGDDRKI